MFSQDLFCERLKSLRIEKGISQGALGSLLGLTPQAISNIEKGRSSATLESLYLLSIHLNVSTDYLMGLTDSHVVGSAVAMDLSEFSQSEEELANAESLLAECLLATARTRLVSARALNDLLEKRKRSQLEEGDCNQ